MITWRLTIYQSGSHAISASVPGAAWFYVLGDSISTDARYQMSRELESWLNGGYEPSWLARVERRSAESVITPMGNTICAVGPMYESEPGNGDWESEQDEGNILRGLLIDALCNRQRPSRVSFEEPALVDA